MSATKENSVPVTSAEFTVQNSNSEMTSMLNMALEYLQKSPAAGALIELASELGIQLGMNPKNTDFYPDVLMADPGTDLFDPGTHMVIWNPYSALEVKDYASGAIIGVQSAALGLLHEIVHGIDPALLSNLDEKLPGTGLANQAEFVALQYESLVASELGEVTRNNVRGNGVDSDNPTTHTTPIDTGLVWTQLNAQGVSEYGGHYESPGQTTAGTVPDFASTLVAWENSGGFEPPDPWENSGGFESPAEPWENSGGFGDPDPVADNGGEGGGGNWEEYDVPYAGLVAQAPMTDWFLIL